MFTVSSINTADLIRWIVNAEMAKQRTTIFIKRSLPLCFLRSPVFRSVGRDMNTQHSLSISATSAAWSKTNLTSTRANHFAAIWAWNPSVMLMVDKTLHSDNNWVIKVWTHHAVLSQNRPLLVITITSSASPPAELVSFCFLSRVRYCKKKINK